MLDVTKPEADARVGRRPLEGRTAIVTGSTSGIGLGIAKALWRRAGAAVMLNGFGDPERDRDAARRRSPTRTMSTSPMTAPTCRTATPSA